MNIEFSPTSRIKENIENKNIKKNIKLLNKFIKPSTILTNSILNYGDINNETFNEYLIPLINEYNIDLKEKENLILFSLLHNIESLFKITINKSIENNEEFNFEIIKTKYLNILAKKNVNLEMFNKSKEIFKFNYDDLKVFNYLFDIINPQICEQIYKNNLTNIIFIKNVDFQIKRIKTREIIGVNNSNKILEILDILVNCYTEQEKSKENINSTIDFFNKKQDYKEEYDIIIKKMNYNLLKNEFSSTLSEKKINKLKI